MLTSLPSCGVELTEVITPDTPISNIILSHARTMPLDAFVLVCQHKLEALAVEISQHLVAVPLYNLMDEHCVAMGPIYLRRLMFLHLGRIERLKGILKELPTTHSPTRDCDILDQKRTVHAAWNAAASEVCWDLAADTSGTHILTKV